MPDVSSIATIVVGAVVAAHGPARRRDRREPDAAVHALAATFASCLATGIVTRAMLPSRCKAAVQRSMRRSSMAQSIRRDASTSAKRVGAAAACAPMQSAAVMNRFSMSRLMAGV
jgi:hypothetical protein